jgi:hypothetical protein
MKYQRSLTKKEAQKEFLQLLAGIVSDFPAHPDNGRVFVPRTFTPLSPLAKFTRRKIEPFVRGVSYTLFDFSWSFSPMSSWALQIGTIPLRNGSRVFWFWDDSREWEEQHFVAGVVAKQVTDLEFLRLLFKRNGKDFGHEMFGAPPTEIQIATALKDHPVLPDLFLSAYRAFPQTWESLLDNPPDGDDLDLRTPEGARELVIRHLREVII